MATTEHGKGSRTVFNPLDLPDASGGARQRRLTDGPGMHYLPYFYNPHLHPAGRRLLYVGDQSGSEQVFALDVERGTATQLTDARGRDQHWAPYIRVGIDGIRPQFIAWSQPDWAHALYWEENALKRVHVESLEEETLYTLRGDAVPQVLHCSAGGWVCFGYIPREVQAQIRETLAAGGRMTWDEALLTRLERGCGFVVFDVTTRRVVADEHVPFWVNHIQASPDNARVLFCQEGPWQRQRMWRYNSAAASYGPLREQNDGAAIGHEFWLDSATVAYHGTLPDKRGFFGRLDVYSGQRTETPSADGAEEATSSSGVTGLRDGRFYGHYHASPDGALVATDGEITSDQLSVARLADQRVRFVPVARHGWMRSRDQRHHPHPHWHSSGRWITFTGCDEHGTQALLLDVANLRLD
ncbi:MAG TPA: oligogalacturonate lyase family protein [Chloroflexota bacterium]|nr:oligogalacturonate lyase family protein [Chloroflexota bacterium]